MTFNIGNQSGGIINNVAGDQTISGGQRGTLVTTDEARAAARELSAALARGPVDGEGGADGGQAGADAGAAAQEIEKELRSPAPDRSRVASALERLTRLYATTRAWARAGAAVLGPIRTIATWLGALGVPVLALLP